jgi:hypothetical protein
MMMNGTNGTSCLVRHRTPPSDGVGEANEWSGSGDFIFMVLLLMIGKPIDQ